MRACTSSAAASTWLLLLYRSSSCCQAISAVCSKLPNPAGQQMEVSHYTSSQQGSHHETQWMTYLHAALNWTIMAWDSSLLDEHHMMQMYCRTGQQ
jgi:hypothetical protein